MHCNPIFVHEEMLIAAVMIIIPINKLPQGQYGCTGHVINLPQDCHLPLELDVIVVRKDSTNQHFKQPMD